jgi:hypothetical protein
MRGVTQMANGEMAELEQAIADYLLEPKKKRSTLKTEIREGVQDILKGLKKIDKKLSSINHVLQGKRK